MDDGERLELYYQSNIGQFYAAGAMGYQATEYPRLTAPIWGRPGWRGWRKRPQSTGMALKTLQQDLGGEVESLGWMTLRRCNGSIPAESTRFRRSGDWQPFSTGFASVTSCICIRSWVKKSSSPGRSSNCEIAVISAYVRQYTSEIYARLEAELLEVSDSSYFRSA